MYGRDAISHDAIQRSRRPATTQRCKGWPQWASGDDNLQGGDRDQVRQQNGEDDNNDMEER